MNTLEEIKRDEIPLLFTGAKEAHAYGSTAENSARDEQVQALLKQASLAGLAGHVSSILACINASDPVKLTRAQGFISRLTGSGLVAQSAFVESQATLEDRIQAANISAARVLATIDQIDISLAGADADAQQLKTQIQALAEYLVENPSAGLESTGQLQFTNKRARVERRLENLRIYLMSMQQTNMQLNMVRQHLLIAHDRYIEAVTITLPLWKKHMISLNVSEKIQGKDLEVAVNTHKKLKTSLAQNLENMR